MEKPIKHRVVSVRMTEDEYQRLNRDAKNRKESMSKHLRELIFRSQITMTWPPPDTTTQTYTYSTPTASYTISYQ